VSAAAALDSAASSFLMDIGTAGEEVASTYASTFRRVNIYMFLVMTLLSVDKLIV